MGKDVIVALDFDSKEKTLAFLDRFTEEKPFVKIGMELFYAEGPSIVREIRARGHKIFLDLKLHDIPNTVKKAMAALSALDVDLVNVHAAGTGAMMSAALAGLTRPDGTRPLLIAVTQLTSTDQDMLEKELWIEKPIAEVVMHYAEIASIVDGPISGEVKATTTDAETMVKEGEAIYALDPKHMVVKIPMTVEGLKAIKALSAKGIPTNCTLIFSATPALLAARAGATYVSPFLGRLDDISQRGIELIETIHDMFLNYPDIETQIIAASVRNPMHVTDCALAGADIATVPYKVIEQMTKHPLTDQGIEKFKADYTAVFGA